MSPYMHLVQEAKVMPLASLVSEHEFWHKHCMNYLKLAKEGGGLGYLISYKRIRLHAEIYWREMVRRGGCIDPSGGQ